MKSFSAFMGMAVILAASCVLWHVTAHSQVPAEKTTLLRDPLADWEYPGAKIQEESNGERLPSIPLHGLHCRTTDPIETVYRFYQKQCEPRFVANQGNGWRPESQVTVLMTQSAQGGQSANFFHSSRKEADTALMIIHQPKRTLTVQISCDPQDKSATDILLVTDEH